MHPHINADIFPSLNLLLSVLRHRGLTMLFLPAYAWIAPMLNFSLEYQNLVPRLWTDWVFYFFLFLVPIVCLARDAVWK